MIEASASIGHHIYGGPGRCPVLGQSLWRTGGSQGHMPCSEGLTTQQWKPPPPPNGIMDSPQSPGMSLKEPGTQGRERCPGA